MLDGKIDICGDEMKTYTVGDCFYYIQNGANIKQGVINGGFPITRIETISNGRFNRDRMGYAGIKDISKYRQYVLEDGDLLMSHINSVQYLGRTVLYQKNNDEIIIHGMNLLKLKANRDIIVPAYAKYYFDSNPFKEQLRRITKKSVNQASFTVNDLKRLIIQCPDISEQVEIISKLDMVRHIIMLRQQEINRLDELVKARFAELFGDPVADSRGWGQVPLKQMLESIRYGTSTPPVFAEDGYCFIRATNIKNGRIVNNDMKHISQYEADRLEKCKLAGGEVLIVRSGVNAGDTCVITDEYIGQYAGYDMILVMKDEMNPIFLNELINTGYMNKVVKPLTRRAAQPHLNSEQVQSFPIIKVPKYLQDEFADFVKQTNKSKAAVQKSLDETQVLFDSLMQKYFG